MVEKSDTRTEKNQDRKNQTGQNIEKRDKNNDAVKRSRQKTKQKCEETMKKVNLLKNVSINRHILS